MTRCVYVIISATNIIIILYTTDNLESSIKLISEACVNEQSNPHFFINWLRMGGMCMPLSCDKLHNHNTIMFLWLII